MTPATSTVTILKPYSLEALQRGAKKRPPGYLETLLSAAKRRSDTHVWLDSRDAARITMEYGNGTPITLASKSGCTGCGNGKSNPSASSVADETWHNAINQTEGQQ